MEEQTWGTAVHRGLALCQAQLCTSLSLLTRDRKGDGDTKSGPRAMLALCFRDRLWGPNWGPNGAKRARTPLGTRLPINAKLYELWVSNEGNALSS